MQQELTLPKTPNLAIKKHEAQPFSKTNYMDQVIAEVRDASNSTKPEDLAKSKITNLLAIQSQRLGQTMSQVKKANQEIEMQ